VGSVRFEHRQSHVSGPLEERPHIMAIGVKRATAVAGQVGGRRQLRLIQRRVLLERLHQHGHRIEFGHRQSSIDWEKPANTNPAPGGMG
jgi:hypothetical protein